MTFYNTISSSGDELDESTEKALKCADFILKVFKEFPRVSFTPFEVKRKLQLIYGKNYPITSVRARMSTLTKKGFLIKSDKATSKGIYKVKNHAWKLFIESEEIAA